MGLWCAQMSAGGWLVMVVVWIGIVALVVWGLSRLFPAGSQADARSILDARLASGEIDAETFWTIRTQLDRDASVATKGSP
ncbi:MAG: hypothetical protein EON96_09995 [Caulobacteraceae bacterium]|nr:MAG: hypothetical protein EON96_09995 [Caulobacteraceae bacterium]